MKRDVGMECQKVSNKGGYKSEGINIQYKLLAC